MAARCRAYTEQSECSDTRTRHRQHVISHKYHSDITQNSHVWWLNRDIIVMSTRHRRVSIILWQHCDLMVMWSSCVSVTSYCENTMTSWWCDHLVYLWHHTMTTLWPHGDVVNICHCDLTNISHMWCHTFDTVLIFLFHVELIFAQGPWAQNLFPSEILFTT